MLSPIAQDFNFWNWLGGMIDGDGCFSISLSRQHNSKTRRICVTPQVAVTARADRVEELEYILENTRIGKIYTRGRSPYPVSAWQTTSGKDSLDVAKKVLPYLVLKRKKCEAFIKVLEYWINTSNPDRLGDKSRARGRGQRLRTQEQMKIMIKNACEINSDRQTRRYKDKLTYEQWEPIIKEWYPN
ncbi:MAG: hypothetical protein KCHDKBKB_00774 [Elusimicrobia bacterium]|nr:hypothetical protein [Elusimicrobiota bacterium]